MPGGGLRFAVALDERPAQTLAVDQATEVTSPEWARNVLDQTTVGNLEIRLAPGRHVLKSYAVDTGVVLDRIVLRNGRGETGYFDSPAIYAR